MFRVDDIDSASVGKKDTSYRRFCCPSHKSESCLQVFVEILRINSKRNKRRPTLTSSLPPLRKVRLGAIPSCLVRIADLVSQRLHTNVDGVEEFECHI